LWASRRLAFALFVSELTWNLRHIANTQIKWRIERTCVSAGYIAPVVCTQRQLMEEL